MTWLESLTQWLREGNHLIGYILLAASSLIEHVLPPFPGDSVTVAGAILASTAGYSWSLVYVALNTGAMVGALIAYSFGRYVASHPSRPKFMQRPRVQSALTAVRDRFEQHGAIYLVLNRFIPAFRAVVFVGAGMARLPVPRVLFFGTLSACIWNAILLTVGYWVGDNWSKLEFLWRRYTAGVVAILLVLLGVWGFRKWRKAKTVVPEDSEPR